MCHIRYERLLFFERMFRRQFCTRVTYVTSASSFRGRMFRRAVRGLLSMTPPPRCNAGSGISRRRTSSLISPADLLRVCRRRRRCEPSLRRCPLHLPFYLPLQTPFRPPVHLPYTYRYARRYAYRHICRHTHLALRLPRRRCVPCGRRSAAPAVSIASICDVATFWRTTWERR